MNQQQNINIKIADVKPMSLLIARDSEEYVRKAERSVNDLWDAWRRDFPDKSPKEVLAMVAFRFAQLYFKQRHTLSGGNKALADFEHELDRLLEIADPQ